jgi:hypothetical protein
MSTADAFLSGASSGQSRRQLPRPSPRWDRRGAGRQAENHAGITVSATNGRRVPSHKTANSSASCEYMPASPWTAALNKSTVQSDAWTRGGAGEGNDPSSRSSATEPSAVAFERA